MIPAWNLSGVLPPFTGGDLTISTACSPYWATTEELARRFAHTPARRAILRGFLEYRRALVSIGIHSGFQWLDGSFLENVEVMESRNPGDIDVVTFGHVPVAPKDVAAKLAFRATNIQLFDRKQTKYRFLCDAFFVDLDLVPRLLVERAKYWATLFSHKRRTYLWKGMIAVELASDDSVAWSFAAPQ